MCKRPTLGRNPTVGVFREADGTTISMPTLTPGAVSLCCFRSWPSKPQPLRASRRGPASTATARPPRAGVASACLGRESDAFPWRAAGGPQYGHAPESGDQWRSCSPTRICSAPADFDGSDRRFRAASWRKEGVVPGGRSAEVRLAPGGMNRALLVRRIGRPPALPDGGHHHESGPIRCRRLKSTTIIPPT